MKTTNHQPATAIEMDPGLRRDDETLRGFDIVTFGCRLNTYESEVMRDHMTKTGVENMAVFNTCAVTKEAERQARQAIRRYKRKHPEKKVVVTGCSAQITPEQYAAMPEVDTVLGNEEKLKKENYLNSQFSILDSEKVQVNDIMSVKETALHLVEGIEGRARAFMQVQNGCNHRCTFCIIPYGRGNSRSVPMGEIVQQAKLLVKKGYAEIVLTGVDMTDYGKDLPGTPTLGAMVRRLLKLVPNLARLRLSSIDVAEIDEDLRWLIEHEKRLMPHLHLSLQSGDDMVLKRMKRRHSRQQVIDFCKWARAVRPEIAFGADIIVGFPTETEAMFQQTLDIVDEAGLQYLHVFPYSERDGTPAAKIPADKQVPKVERKQRAARLREKGNTALARYLVQQSGKILNVVVEKHGIGRSESFCEVVLHEEGTVGEQLSVVVEYSTDGVLCEQSAELHRVKNPIAIAANS